MEENKKYMTPQFLSNRMKQAKAVDNVLSDSVLKSYL